MAINLTDQNFDQEVIKSDRPALVDFWAPWCGPCQMMGPIIEELSAEFKEKIKIFKLNVDENQESAAKYEIMSIPAVKIFKDGKIIKEFIGLQSKEAMAEELRKLIS